MILVELIWCTTLLCYLEWLIDMQEIGHCTLGSLG